MLFVNASTDILQQIHASCSSSSRAALFSVVAGMLCSRYLGLQLLLVYMKMYVLFAFQKRPSIFRSQFILTFRASRVCCIARRHHHLHIFSGNLHHQPRIRRSTMGLRSRIIEASSSSHVSSFSTCMLRLRVLLGTFSAVSVAGPGLPSSATTMFCGRYGVTEPLLHFRVLISVSR